MAGVLGRGTGGERDGPAVRGAAVVEAATVVRAAAEIRVFMVGLSARCVAAPA